MGPGRHRESLWVDLRIRFAAMIWIPGLFREGKSLKRSKADFSLGRLKSKSISRLCSLLVFLAALGAADAYGHATLLHTEPDANTRVSNAPTKIILIFDERVEPVFNSIRVVGQQGKRVDQGEARVVGEGDAVEVDLQPLGEGPYAVLWRINSVDGHQVQGHFGFGVRSDPPDEKSLQVLAVNDQGPFWKFFLPIMKWAGLTAMVLWLGGISFLLVVLAPALAGSTEADVQYEFIPRVVRRPLKILWIGAILFLVVECLALIGHAVTLANTSLVQTLSVSTLRMVLATTNYGQWWTVKILSALGLLALCFWTLRSVPLAQGRRLLERGRGTLLGIGSGSLAGLILLTIPMTGHARAVSQWTIVAVGSDWVHLAGTVIWIGGLVHFLAVVLFVDNSGDDKVVLLNNLAHRFSRVARICVLFLLATGVYNAWLHMPTWLSFVSTDYGRVLVAKLLILVPILWIASVNLRRVLPALAAFAQHPDVAHRWANRFRKLIQAEATLGVVILALVASLTSLPRAAAVAVDGSMNLSKRTGDTTVGLSLNPNKVGTNQVVVTVQDSNGRTVSEAKRVTLYLRSLDMDMGLQTVQAQPSSDGTYGAEVFLSMAGRWLISVEVSPPRGDTFVTEFEISSTL